MIKKIFLFTLFIFPLANFARAQTNSELLLTWEAQNYAPPEYLGKHLATPGSIIAVSAELIVNGKLQDARQSSFSWYVDGKLLQKGAGLKEISFPVKKSQGNEYTIRAVTKFGGKNIEGTIRVPVSRPEVIIQHPYQNNIVAGGGDARVRVQPYFFSVPSLESLRVSWTLQDVPKGIFSAAQDFIFGITFMIELYHHQKFCKAKFPSQFPYKKNLRFCPDCSIMIVF